MPGYSGYSNGKDQQPGDGIRGSRDLDGWINEYRAHQDYRVRERGEGGESCFHIEAVARSETSVQKLGKSSATVAISRHRKTCLGSIPNTHAATVAPQRTEHR